MAAGDQDWNKATKANPCPACANIKWCMHGAAGGLCNNGMVPDGCHDGGEKNGGARLWWHQPPAAPGDRPAPPPKPAKPAAPRGTSGELDRVYSRLLTLCPLTVAHREHLATERRLSPEGVTAFRFGSLPSGRKLREVAQTLSKELGDMLLRIPGFVVGKDGAVRIVAARPSAGILIPYRDGDTVTGMRLRLDDAGKGGKYRWLSGGENPSGEKGPSVEQSAYVVAPATMTPGLAILTEGEFKAHAAANHWEALAIGVPGVDSHRLALPALKDHGAKEVLLAFDADHAEKKPEGKPNRVYRNTCDAVETLREQGFIVRLLLWHQGLFESEVPKGVDDAIHAGAAFRELSGEDIDAHLREVGELLGLTAPAAEIPPEEDHRGARFRPRCEVSADLDKSRTNLDSALEECSDPMLYNKGGVLVCIKGHETYQPAAPSLAMELAQKVAFCKKKQAEEGEERFRPCLPPPALTMGMVAAPHLFPSVKSLRRLVTSPRILADGSITMEPGYYPCAQTYYTGKIRIGDLSMSLEEAVRILEEPFQDFPFEEPSDKANALSVPLSLACADLYRGLTPINVPVASKFGTGKSLLIQVPVTLVTGRPAMTIDHEDTGESFTKEITTALIQSPDVILIDNVSTTLDSPRLAAIMTAPVTHARILGGNRQATLENTCFWAATGNSIEMTGEMVRRAYVTRIDANMENPEERRNFGIPNLKDTWINDPDNQKRYVTACLVIARAWLAAGSPRFTRQLLGSFRDWCEVIGGMLEMIGHGDFLANKDHFRATTDPEQEMWRDLVTEWWASFGNRGVTTKDLLDVITLNDVTRSDLEPSNYRDHPLIPLRQGTTRAQTTSLGMLMRRKVAQVFRISTARGQSFDVKIVSAPGNRSRSLYHLHPIAPDSPADLHKVNESRFLELEEFPEWELPL